MFNGAKLFKHTVITPSIEGPIRSLVKIGQVVSEKMLKGGCQRSTYNYYLKKKTW